MNEKQLLEALKQEIGSCGTRLFDLLIQRFEHLKEEHPFHLSSQEVITSLNRWRDELMEAAPFPVQTISVGALLSHRHSYGNDKVEITREVPPGADYRQIHRMTQAECYELLGRMDLFNENQRLRREYQDLSQQVEQARQEWAKASTFLVAQGLKTQVDPFPLDPLPALSAPSDEVVEGELEEDPTF